MNEKLMDIMKLARIELVIIPIFIFFKYIRPGVLKSKAPEFFKITLLSLPNFFEAIIGVLTLTGIILLINDRLKKHQIKPKILYIIAVALAAAYVILQELNIINIRTNTTFDSNDIIFSILGLIFGYWIIQYIKPQFPSTKMNTQ
ncbi:hypothetical protein [uncultured Croceitalea sp.]|uniref:hypothetical protein n=1 Tax=uncultured Croceitalea sp. TaxID=1798908 RepID=UPI0033061C9D